MLTSPYMSSLKKRAAWLMDHIHPMSDEHLSRLVRSRMDQWEPEFQAAQSQSQ